MTWMIGRSDANDRFVVPTHDERGVCRELDLTIDGEHRTMTRENPDFHQRFIGEFGKDRMAMSVGFSSGC